MGFVFFLSSDEKPKICWKWQCSKVKVRLKPKTKAQCKDKNASWTLLPVWVPAISHYQLGPIHVIGDIKNQWNWSPHTHTLILTPLGISSNSLILKLNLGPTFHPQVWSLIKSQDKPPTNHLIMTTHVSFKPYLWPTFFLLLHFCLLVNELNQKFSPWLKLCISKFIIHWLPDNQYINWVSYSWQFHLLFVN